jgi:hypothetical protein
MSHRRGRHLISSDLWDARHWREHWADLRHKPLNETLPAPPPVHMLAPGFSLYPETERALAAEERSEDVDHFLRAMKVRPRRAVDRLISKALRPR